MIGRADFKGSYTDPRSYDGFAKAIGADTVIASSQLSETRTSFIGHATYTSFGVTSITVPVESYRYEQSQIYLKNINNAPLLWEGTRSDYPVTGTSALDGIWNNLNYQVEIVTSNGRQVAFLTQKPNSTEPYEQGTQNTWNPDDLKFLFSADSKVGVYLMGDRAPIPAGFEINRFGHLEVTFFTNQRKLSFEKIR